MRFALSALGLLALICTAQADVLGPDAQSALEIHNRGRSQLGLAGLAWDDGLARGAQDWANRLANIGALQHSQSGQNLYMSTGASGHDLADAARMWMDERGNYHGEHIPDGPFDRYGHFTQCVWRGTSRLGMASARAPNGAVYVVAHYDPVGNYVGQVPY